MLTALRTGTLPREARDTLFLLLVVAWIILPQAANLPLWCLLLAAGLLAWRAHLALRSRPLPGGWTVFGLLVLGAAATYATHRTLLGRDAGVTLIVILLALKTLELRARRDAFVVFFLGFFTMLTNFFFSQSLTIAAAMLVGLMGLLTALVNAHLPVGRPPLLEAAKTAGWMALLGAPIMAVMFVLFPRLAPLWGMPGDALQGRTGLSSSMEVGTIASLVLNDAIALRARFEGPPPPQGQIYFRGPVLSTFDGRTWQPLFTRPGMRFPSPPLGNALLQVRGEPIRYEVTLEPHNRPWLLTLDAAAEKPQAPGLEAFQTNEMQWLAGRPVTDLVRYRAVSHPDYHAGPQNRIAVLGEYTRLPPGFNPRTAALAAEMLRAAPDGGADKRALVQAVLERLRTGGYQYTLEPGTYGEHTADEFWFDRKLGFCEHIASAFAVLMRAMDIPARIVTGYQGGELNGVDGFWTVRQSDAHAWTELWLPGEGWVRIDPTAAVAPSRIGSLTRLQPAPGVFAAAVGTLNPTLAASLRQAWEALNNSWNQWVLNYTQSKQLDLLRNIGFSAPGWEDLGLLLIGIVVLAALAGAGWTLWERSQHDPWLRLLESARRRLRKAGLELPPSSPPREIARLVTTRFGPDARGLAQWLLKLEAQRYARTSPATLAALRREYRELAWPT